MTRPPERFEDSLREYWEDPETVSIIDRNLHDLETRTVLRYLEAGDVLVDVGCGDGEATVEYARRVRECIGIERSAMQRRRAEAAIAREGLTNARVIAGDVMTLDAGGVYDAIVSQRLLINLSSWDRQKHALLNIHRALRPGGRLLMVENTNEGFQAMNDVRAAVGLEPVLQHWHNLFFAHDQLTDFLRGRFQLIRHHDFGLYYLLTRCYVPMFAPFTGFGRQAVKDPLYEVSDPAALRLFDVVGARVRIEGGPAFGPIQMWALRREDGTADQRK